MSVEHYHSDDEYHCDGICDAVADEPECEGEYAHRWTARGTGGCDTNPGVWSLGGTTYRFVARCIVCGVQRKTTVYGSQRNPGECDRVRYYAGVVDEAEARLEKARQRKNASARERRRRARARAATDAKNVEGK